MVTTHVGCSWLVWHVKVPEHLAGSQGMRIGTTPRQTIHSLVSWFPLRKSPNGAFNQHPGHWSFPTGRNPLRHRSEPLKSKKPCNTLWFPGFLIRFPNANTLQNLGTFFFHHSSPCDKRSWISGNYPHGLVSLPWLIRWPRISGRDTRKLRLGSWPVLALGAGPGAHPVRHAHLQRRFALRGEAQGPGLACFCFWLVFLKMSHNQNPGR